MIDRLFSVIRKIWKSPPRHTLRSRSYQGAKRGRVHGDWLAYGTSSNAEIYSSLRTLRNRSRDLIRNDDYARGIIRQIVKNVVYQGIVFQSQVKQLKDKKKNDNVINTRIETAWKKWCQKDSCDVTGSDSFNKLQQLVFRAYLESGEVFVRKIKQSFGGSEVAFALEVIESDQIADDYNSVHNGNEIVMGVELNQWRRPVGYWIYDYHPGDFWFGTTSRAGRSAPKNRELIRVSAKEMIHLYHKERPGAVRGVPILYSTIARLRNLGKYEEAELVAARAAANYMGVITSEFEDLGEPDTDKDGSLNVSETEAVEETLTPGIIKRLASGESFESFTPNRPNSAFENFHRGQLRASAVGVGLAFEGASGDYSQSNYSSSRLSLLDVRDVWKMMQQDFIEDFLQPVYQCWLEQAVLSGVLNFADYARNSDRYYQIKWQPRGWSWVDPWKETQASLAAIAAGTTTYTKLYAEQGEDFEEALETIAREREMMARVGFSPVLGKVNDTEEKTN